jgi:hypothetical protein
MFNGVIFGTEWTSGTRHYIRYFDAVPHAEAFGHYLMSKGRTGVAIVELDAESGLMFTFWTL